MGWVIGAAAVAVLTVGQVRADSLECSLQLSLGENEAILAYLDKSAMELRPTIADVKSRLATAPYSEELIAESAALRQELRIRIRQLMDCIQIVEFQGSQRTAT